MQTELFQQEDEDSPIFSVTQVTKEVKKCVETNFRQVWIRGEVSNLRAHSSGHFYFILKDSKAQLKAVLFRGDAMGLAYLPKEGDECLAFGDITIYEPRGEYQIRVRHLMQDGLGSLRAQFEKLKENLLQEGLFEESRKKPLPKLPTKIGVITSTTGAALQDFVSILQRRKWGGELFLFHSSVQGKSAPRNLIKAVEQASSFSEIELIVLTRGGGSLEDLWAFNDEQLVRTLADCAIPTISAIGHQTDFVLTDFVADLRAETPSGAAEWLSSQFLSYQEFIQEMTVRLQDGPREILSRYKDQLELLSVRLDRSSPIAQIEKHHQYLDEWENRLNITRRHRSERIKDRLQSLQHRLNNCSLQASLQKGFSYIKNKDGKILSSSKMLQSGSIVQATFMDGTKDLKVQD
ncbi:MAG: exodeoxyribonuclease VII large subunit [Opitutales bacterium]|nr:exodeoxyribonuclease VII large subunit [Opitutales bacterium]